MVKSIRKYIELSLCCISLSVGFHNFINAQISPQLVVQTGHNRSEKIESLSISSNGKLLASAGIYTVKIWDVDANRELRSLNIGGSPIQKIAFNEYDTSIIVRNGGRITAWEIKSGQPIWTIVEADGAFSVSADGKFIVHQQRANLLIRDANTGDKIREIEFDNKDGLRLLAVSRNAEKIAVAGNGGELKIINAVSGGVSLELPNQERWVDRLIFSPNGEKLISVIGEKISIWDSASGKLLQTITNLVERFGQKPEAADVKAIEFSPDNRTIVVVNIAFDKLLFFDIVSGKLSSKLEFDAKDFNTAFSYDSVGFNSDGKFLAGAINGSVLLWDLSGRKIAKTFKGNTLRVAHVDFSPTEKTIVSIGEFGVNNFGNYGLSGQGRTVSFWSNNGMDFRFLKGNATTPTAGWTKDGRSIFTVEMIKEQEFKYAIGVKQWDVSSTNEQQKFPVRFDTFDRRLLQISPVGDVVAAVDWDAAKTSFYELKSGRLIGEIGGQQERYTGFKFSPDGKLFATGSLDKTVKLWRTQNGELVHTFNLEKEAENPAFNKDGSLLSAKVGNSLKIWRTTDGAEIKTIENVKCAAKDFRYHFLSAFSSDNRLIACASTDRKESSAERKSEAKDLGTDTFQISLYDLADGKLLRRLEGHQQEITSLAFSPDDKYLVSGSDDSQTKLWRVADAKELASMIVFNEKDWLVTTPDGFFDGSPNAWKQLSWRFNNDTFDYAPVETYFNDFFYPNLLQDVLDGNSPKPKDGSELEKIDRRQPNVKIVSAEAQNANRTATIVIEITDNNVAKKQPNHAQTSGAKDLRLLRNGSLVKVWHDDVFDKTAGCESLKTKTNEPRRVRCSAIVPIIAGENNFTAYAFNSANIKSNDDSAGVEGKFEKRDGTLYVLAIGVNKYANEDFNLRFAVPDVDDITRTIEAEQSKLRTDTKVKQYAKTEIITLTDETATKDNILLALNNFSKQNLPENLCGKLPENLCNELKIQLGKIKPATPEDALIVHFSGHGTSSGQRFYLLPHNFTGRGDESLIEQTVSDIELNEVLEKVDAGKMLMIIDACRSGQALGGQNEGRAPMNSKGLAQLAYDKGMMILTAAQSFQAALEAVRIGDKEIKHGLLTYTLLEALQNPQAKADRDNNKQLWEREWFDFAVEQVPQLQTAAMKQREIDLQKGNPDVKDKSGLFYVGGDDPKAKPENRRVQTPRVFYRREIENNPMIVSKN